MAEKKGMSIDNAGQPDPAVPPVPKGNTLMPYPSALGDAPRLLLDAVRMGDGGSAQAVHAAWQVSGFGLGYFYPDNQVGESGVRSMSSPKPEGVSAKPLGSITEPDGCAALEKLCKHCEAPVDPSQPKQGLLADMIIKQAIAYATQLLQQWLAKLPSL